MTAKTPNQLRCTMVLKLKRVDSINAPTAEMKHGGTPPAPWASGGAARSPAAPPSAAPSLHPAAAHHFLLGTALHHFPGGAHRPLHCLLCAWRHGAPAHATWIACAAADATWTACATATRSSSSGSSSGSTRSACALGKHRGSKESKCSREYDSLFHPEVLLC